MVSTEVNRAAEQFGLIVIVKAKIDAPETSDPARAASAKKAEDKRRRFAGSYSKVGTWLAECNCLQLRGGS